jgi:hypothetical protein
VSTIAATIKELTGVLGLQSIRDSNVISRTSFTLQLCTTLRMKVLHHLRRQAHPATVIGNTTVTTIRGVGGGGGCVCSFSWEKYRQDLTDQEELEELETCTRITRNIH